MIKFVGQLKQFDCIELIGDGGIKIPYMIQAIAWLQGDEGYDRGQFHLMNGEGERIETLYMIEQYNVIESPWKP